MLNWLERASRWAKLTALGNSGIVKSAVLMPAFGYMLLLNDNVHEFLKLNFDGALLNFLPSTWRIWMVFYGSFAVAMGSVLYGWKCPPEIKRFANPMDYVNSDIEYHFAANRFDTMRREIKAQNDALPDWQKKLDNIKSYKHITGIPGSQPEARSILVAVMGHYFEMLNLTFWGWRALIYILFRVGITLLVIPATITFIQVTWLAIRRVF